MAAGVEDRVLERGLEAVHVGQLSSARGLDSGGGPVQHRLEHPEGVQDGAVPASLSARPLLPTGWGVDFSQAMRALVWPVEQLGPSSIK